MQMFDADSKNYHVWSYRQWLVRQFNLWDEPREIADVEVLLNNDVRNNSAWNHRYLLRFAPREGPEAAMAIATSSSSSLSSAAAALPSSAKGRLEVVDEEVVDAELEYAQKKILLAPENKSPWLYARGVLRAAGRPLSEWKGFASRFIVEEIEQNQTIETKGGSSSAVVHVKSSLALEWLADVLGEEAAAEENENGAEKHAKVNEAVKLLTLLKEKYDPIRKNYWDYRIGQFSMSTAAA